MPRRLALTFGFLVVLTSCDIVGLGSDLEIANVETGSSTARFFLVPDSVSVNAPFEVAVFTVGSCGDRKGQTEVVTQGNAAVIVPYDYHNGSCTLDIQLGFEHRVSLSFDVIGYAKVTLRARDWPNGRDVVFTEAIVVR